MQNSFVIDKGTKNSIPQHTQVQIAPAFLPFASYHNTVWVEPFSVKGTTQNADYIDHEKYFSILAAVTCGYIFYTTART